MRSLRYGYVLGLFCLTTWLAACAAKYIPPVPPQTNDGWETANLGDVGLDAKPLGKLITQIQRKRYENIHSILIARHGKLVFEKYFGGYRYSADGKQFRGEFVDYGVDTPHNLASVTKAFTAALVGIAIDRGYIRDVNEKVFDFFPQYPQLKDERKDRITIEHLLTMTSGLGWNEMDVSIATLDSRHDLIRMWKAPDPIEYILEKTMVAEPGNRWYYSGGDVNLLGEIIKRATKSRMDRFGQKYLFEPLGITDHKWMFLRPNIVYASGDLKLRPRDMLKFGQLHLNGGTWKGRRVLSRQWVEQSTRAHHEVSRAGWRRAEGDRYGYQWFLRTYHTTSGSYECYLRTGWGGQRIIVFPSLEMVVVFTAGNYVTRDPENEIVARYILPAVRGR